MSKDIQDRLGKLEGQVAKLEGHSDQLNLLKGDFKALADRLAALEATSRAAPAPGATQADINTFVEANAAAMAKISQGQADGRKTEIALQLATPIKQAWATAKLPSDEDALIRIADPGLRAQGIQEMFAITLRLLRARPDVNAVFINALVRALFPRTTAKMTPAPTDYDLRNPTDASSGCPAVFFGVAQVLLSDTPSFIDFRAPRKDETPQQHLESLVFLNDMIKFITGQHDDHVGDIRTILKKRLFQGITDHESRTFDTTTTIAEIAAFLDKRPELQLHSSTSTAPKPSNNSTSTTATGNARSTRAERRAKKAQQQSGTATVAATSSSSSSNSTSTNAKTNEAPAGK